MRILAQPLESVAQPFGRIIAQPLERSGPGTPFNAVASDNLIFIGASLEDRAFSAAAELTWIDTVATHLGYANVIERSVSGETFAQTLVRMPDVLTEFAASAANNVYVLHRSGNDVTNDRPYTAAEFDQWHSNLKVLRRMIKDAGSSFIFANISYRPYDEAPAIDPHSGLPDTDGALPYNTEVVDPFIRDFNAEWWDEENDKPVLDLYGFTRGTIGYIAVDRIHMTPSQEDVLIEWYLTKIRDHIAPVAVEDMTGRSIFLDVANVGTHRDRTGGKNRHSFFTGYVVDTLGAACDGVSVEWKGFATTASNGAGAGAEARIADTRFHGAGTTTLTYQTFVSSVANLSKTRELFGEIHVHGLEPGAEGDLVMVGTRASATGTDRKMVVTTDGGQTTATLDAATNVASNQITLPFTVPASGTLVIRCDIHASSIFGYFDACILDFD